MVKIVFHIYEKSINIDKVDIKRIVLSNKESCGNKVQWKWDKIKKLCRKKFDSSPEYNDKYIRTKINSYKLLRKKKHQ